MFGAPHGLRGELRLGLITDAPEQRLGAPRRLWVRRRTGWSAQRSRAPPQPVRLSQTCLGPFLCCRPPQEVGSPWWLWVQRTAVWARQRLYTAVAD